MNEPMRDTIMQYPLHQNRKRMIHQRFVRCCILPIIFLLASLTNGEPPLCLKEEPRPEDPYQYVHMMIGSIAYIKAAQDRGEKLLSIFQMSKLPLLANLEEMLFYAKMIDQDYTCAASIVSDYIQSKNEFIHKSAEGMQTSYTWLADLNKQVIPEIIGMLKAVSLDKPELFDITASANRIADIRVDQDSAWQMFYVSGAAAVYVIVQMPKKEGEELSRLSVTEKQRKQLMKDLDEIFGASLKKGVKTDQYVEGVGVLLYQYLSDKRWKSLDSN
jgi:hypothetical protein